MLDVVGSPGTWSSLALRVLQFVFATGSAIAMASGGRFATYVAFSFISYEMTILALWAFTVACIDILSLKNSWDLHNIGNIWIYLLADCALAICSLGAVSSASGVTLLLKIDSNYCGGGFFHICIKFQISVILGSIAMASIISSALSTSWLLISLYN